MTSLLEMKQITKKYGTLVANDHVNLSLNEGEVHALVGENGAGKTTLMRMLYGMEQPTEGQIFIKGELKNLNHPMEAIKNGIGMVHQHFMLFPAFSVAENIVIGAEPAKGLRFDREQAVKKVEELSRTYKMPIDPRKKIQECSVGVQQRVEILKVLYHQADIIILDEPTAVLTPLEVKEMLATIKGLAKQGKSVIFITHKLHEVMEVADRITVLRGGRVTGSLDKSRTSLDELSRLMVGRDLTGIERPEKEKGKTVLMVDNLYLHGDRGKPVLDHLSFQVHAGEIVGIAGVSGNGQSELLQVITGLQPPDQGKVTLNGTDVTNKQVKDIRETGLAHIPEDRYLWGTAAQGSVKENAIMGHHRKGLFQHRSIFKHKSIDRKIKEWIQEFAVKTGSIHTQAQHLSGGNLQKLIIAREMKQETPLLIAAEPTRGVDIGAMEFIHEQLVAKRNRGDAVLLISSELSEIFTLSDRIFVMYEGKIVGEMLGKDATEEQIGFLMAGGNVR